MKKETKGKRGTLRLLKWENGFVNPIKIIPGPQGGAFVEEEFPLMFEEEDGDLEVVIYELKSVRTCKLKDLGSKND